MSVQGMPKKITRGSKDEIYWKILNAVIALDFRKGHQRWTMSELSRVSGVKRPLIYYYFGKSKREILREALRLLGEEFFGLSEERIKLWESGDIVGSVARTREIAEKASHLGAFYLAHREKDTEFGEVLRQHEINQFKKIEKYFPNKTADERKAIWAVLFGLTFTPLISPQAIQIGVGLIKSRAN